ncbi:hypothetical protein SAMN04490248_11417 [Salinihabitans flavidus]|uniref:DUF2194 domain-containing protein n=1 Tax=Salinihabitans flavidus TaxID=569882 RepID=A0A1H8T2R1_9RHOB|nr:DUF2194 domain-containing protein [Salinihabitans flavidus]SEO85232.1 hypothetical protein SAMN04490248_11417 [Salinihabitans flavidus]
MPLKFFRSARRSDAAQPDRRPRQEVLVLCHGGDLVGLGVMQNTLAALGAARIRYTVLDLAIRRALPAFDRYAALVICTSLLEGLGAEKSRAIEDWVVGGKGVFVAIRCWHSELGSLFGLPSRTKPPLVHSFGLDFRAELAPHVAGLHIDLDEWVFEHIRFVLDPTEPDLDCQIVLKDQNGAAIAWRRAFGQGRVVFWNSDVLQARVLRGILLQGILDAMGTAAAAIAGFATINIDDFPPSISSATPEQILREYPDLDESGFFFGPWLSDMLDLRSRHDLRYSWYCVMDYGATRTGPPDDDAVKEGARILAMRFERAAPLPSDDEIGFHGYSHQIATDAGVSDPQSYREGLQLARRLWQDHVPVPMPTSWVPAGNQYHAVHAQMIATVIPEITTVAGLHSIGAPDQGEYREFGPEPWCEDLYCLPRNNFGYTLRPKQRILLLSQIAGSGAWTHFLHPDDILDEPRPGINPVHVRNPHRQMWQKTNAAGQQGLFREFEAFVEFVTTSFPWLRFVTNSEASTALKRFDAAQVDLRVGPDAIEINSEESSLFYLRVQTGESLSSAQGGRLVWKHAVVGGTLYVADCPSGISVFKISR